MKKIPKNILKKGNNCCKKCIKNINLKNIQKHTLWKRMQNNVKYALKMETKKQFL